MEAIELRNSLREVEEKIKNLVGEEQMAFCSRNRKYTPIFDEVFNLILVRYRLLNRMFTATPDEVERFEKVNALLAGLAKQMCRHTASLYRSMLSCRDESFDDDYEAEGTLRHDTEYISEERLDDVLCLDNDEYYASDFAYMIPLVWLLEEESQGTIGRNIESCRIFYDKGHTPTSSDEDLGCSDWTDNGINWAEGYLHNPKLEHICMCHAVHSICTHHAFSIPDLLRMNRFQIEVKNICRHG